MSQRPRLSTDACAQAEEACDHAANTYEFWLLAWHDRRIDEREAAALTAWLTGTLAEAQETVSVTSKVDEGLAEAVALMRGGPDSDAAKRFRTERRLRMERAAIAG